MADKEKIERAIVVRPGREPGVIADEEREVTNIARGNIAQTVEVYKVQHRQYWAPFNYPNFTVELGREGVGAEFNPDGVELDVPPYGAITFEEDQPIMGVTVIGSACCPPGTVFLQGEPLEWKYPRTGVKSKAENLWGEHEHHYPWGCGVTEAWREAGLSSCHFELPECKKVTLMGWSQLVVGQKEIDIGKGHDGHYCFRIIRVTVKEGCGDG